VPSDTRTLIAPGTDLEPCCILKPLTRGRKGCLILGTHAQNASKFVWEDKILV